MIVWYFCQRLILIFFLILTILAALLSAVNVVGKNIFSSPELVLALFFGALPFMAVFIYSFALVCASFLVFYTMHQRGEFVVVQLFSQLRKKLFLSSLFHTIIVGILFIPLIFWVAPRSYDWGKELLYVLLEQKLSVLSPGFLHFPAPGLATYFEKSEHRGAVTIFHNFFLIQESKNALDPSLKSLLWGEQACLSDKKIFLQKSILIVFNNKNKESPFSMITAFDNGILNLGLLLEVSPKKNSIAVKYQTIKDLWSKKNKEAIVERYRRYLQIGWSLLTPILMHFFCLSWHRIRKIYFLFYVAGGWFFCLYILLLLVPLFVEWFDFLALPFLFLPVFGVLCLLYKKFL